jgi:hypothetical protein
MQPRIAYLSVDDVNHSLAQQIADAHGVPLVHVFAPDVAPKYTCPVRLHDLDHFSSLQSEAILDRLRAGRHAATAAVHSYNLAETEIGALRENGVIVARGLDRALFRRLRDACQPDLGPLPVAGDDAAEASAEPIDPEGLGRLVRSVAARAHTTLTRATPGWFEDLPELEQQLGTLQAQLDRLRSNHALRLAELQKWLDCLAQQIDDRRQALAARSFAR